MMTYLNQLFGQNTPHFVRNVVIAIIAVTLGLAIRYLLKRIFFILCKYWGSYLINVIVKRLSRPVAFFLPLLLLNISLGFMQMNPKYLAQLGRILEIALTINFCVLLIQLIKVMEDYFFHRYDLSKEDNLKERKLRTQFQFIRKFTVGLIITITAALILLSFESMRKIGTGLLTGVGIGGIIIGFAAQKSLANLLAGFQIAFTQPIRIDDVVIVEGEWGRVEEITLTYVVVNIWDQRRLILPITYFIEKPFQNWTRVSAQLLGTVFLYFDYNIPIPPLREELTKVLNAHRFWDKRVNVVQVTDNKQSTIEVRFLMSARNSSQAFDLRCDVREHMIAFVRDHYPESLPKTRLEYKENS